jgi:uncharacterized protein
MKRYLVLSDTHLPKKTKGIPDVIIRELEQVDGIIHLGDFSAMNVYQTLQSFAPTEAVYGNIDSKDVQDLLPIKKVLEIEGVKVGIIHGHGQGKTTERRVLDAFENVDVDLILFGHSHIPLKKALGDKVLFNPGSPTDKRRQRQFSYGILEVHDSRFNINHHFFD